MHVNWPDWNLSPEGSTERALLKIGQQSIIKKLTGNIGQTLSPKRWIFVIGCYNSGTTLLAKILSQYPEIAGLPAEGVTLSDVLPRPEEFGWTRMWCKCQAEMAMPHGLEGKRLAQRIQRQWSCWYDTSLPNLLDKSIANATRLPFLQAYFRPAYFVYIVRNGYAVAEGIQRKAEPERWGNPKYEYQYPLQLCAKQWRKTDEVVSQDKKNIDRIITIKYENLVEKTTKTINKIASFIGVNLDPQVKYKKWRIDDKKERIKNMNTRSIKRLADKDIYDINRVTKDTLRKYGYHRNP